MLQQTNTLTVLALLSACALGQSSTAVAIPEAAPTDRPSDPAILAETLEAHVRFLASDELDGRRTGTEQAKLAAHYLATALERAGIEPAGEEGSFFQSVPLIEYSFESNPSLLVTLRDGTSWTAEQGPDFRLRVRGAPDSAATLDVRSIEDAPQPALSAKTALFVPGSRKESEAWLEAQGHGAGHGLGLLIIEGSKREGRARPMRGNQLQLLAKGKDPGDQILANGRLREALNEGLVASVALNSNATTVDHSCQNVVGILRGVGTPEQPELATETIVISAHYDHIGPRASADEAGEEGEPEKDRIYNGADDDASGVAAVLELAEAFGAAEAPARTLVFLLATGEEVGLLGTKHYLDDPVVPLEQTYYNLNIEMIGRPDDLLPGPGSLWLTGWDETTLGSLLAGADQPVQRDPRPEQNFYQRSDNIAFVRRGIMGQTLSSYGMHTDYHTPSDEADSLDFAHMETATNNILRVARALAIDGLHVDWRK